VQDFTIRTKRLPLFAKKKIALYLFVLVLGLIWSLGKEMKSIFVKENLN